MAEPLPIYEKLALVPVRFTRAVDPTNPDAKSGPPRADAPDVDDRSGKEPTVGVANGDRVHIKLVRQNIGTAAKLYATSSDPVVFAIDMPMMVSSPVDAGLIMPEVNTILRLHALAAGEALLEVRYAEPDGIIIGQLKVRVSDVIDVPTQAHLVTITESGGASGVTARTAADVRALFRTVNAIWRPCGINFDLQPVGNANMPLAAGDPLANAGVVTIDTDPNNSDYSQFVTLMGVNRQPNAANAYLVRNILDVQGAGIGGLGLSLAASPNDYGACITDAADANDMAHELGHILNIVKDDGAVRKGAHADDDPDVNHKREDLFTRRRLMHSYNPQSAAGFPKRWRHDAGYGRYKRGALITMIDHAHDRTDGECVEARSHAVPPLP